MVLPGLSFLARYAWLFLEPLATGDRAPHLLVEQPGDDPGPVAFAGGACSRLLVAWGSDLAATDGGRRTETSQR